MCGICGWISWEAGSCPQERLKVVNLMNRALFHRGPDDQNIWASVNSRCIFGHTRLVVVDSQGGRQPMNSRDLVTGEDFTITYNGELYNCEELRAQLKEKGHEFKSYSDTEVLLKAYIEWREECLCHLNGIFAFAVWHNDTLFIARDRLGVKPFFYSIFKNNFLFGSEVKALLEHPLISSDVPLHNLSSLFALGIARPCGFVPFADIQELMPGYAATFTERDGLKLWQYWELDHIISQDSIEEAARHIHFLLKDASIRQLVSDVPHGALVSGGIDSCAITHFAYEQLQQQGHMPNKDLLTFSLKLPEYSEHFQPSLSRYDNDEDFVRLMLSRYGTDHRWICASSVEINESIERSTIAKDYPVSGDLDTSMYILFQKIKPWATMVLSGEGSDEIFGGYTFFYLDSLFPGLPNSTALSYEPLLKNEVKEQLKLRDRELQIYQDIIKKCPLQSNVGGSNQEEEEFRKRIYLAVKYFMPFMLERKDRLSMSSGVEVRVPFTDHRLVEYVFRLPRSFKMYSGIEKYVLRKSMEVESPVFPEEIRNRKKTSYPSAVDPDTLRIARGLLIDLLNSTDTEPIFRWFDKKKVAEGLETGFKAMTQVFMNPELTTCMNLYSINFWFKKYKVNVV